ncbi:uncharacterized protein LOC119080290 isoform X2 [Bradysia coprophila]|uniref:uncharacterized protein LOC119080290 isoform X2 n=1 Tax=Bradysia coprophila TaxID=38358 RepID=UPI00187D8260|nr:uncharacterized protein LOC119080290 isoform X2 [Bradysia coprophila]
MTELSDYYLERLGSHNPAAVSIPLRVGANTIGRLPTNNIVLSSKYASRRHCTIYVIDTNKLTAKNDASTNGIFVNGMQRTDRDVEICLNVNDIVGIGCDTSKDEIVDTECFIFKIKRNEVEIKMDEIITLDDSDEEEEYKILEEYSQMNLSEMKQEYMECEDLVEEMNLSKNDPDVEFVPIENPAIAGDNFGEIDADDVFEEIIANSNKSCAEKTEMIKSVVPNVSSFLMKDCAVAENDRPGVSSILKKECAVDERDKLPSKRIKETKEKKKSKTRDKRESSERRKERRAVKKSPKAASEHHRDGIKVERSPSPRIKELTVTIPLTRVSSPNNNIRESSSAREKGSKDGSNKRIDARHSTVDRRKSSSTSSAQKECRNDSKRRTRTKHSRTRNSSASSTSPAQEECRNDSKRHSNSRNQNSSVSSTSPVQKVCQNESTKTPEATPSRVLKRRHTYVPTSISSAEKRSRNDSKTLPEATHSRSRNSHVPPSASPPEKVCQNDSTKPPESTYSRIMQRRKTFVPSSTLSSGSIKRQVEVIDAPRMMKRRKSISAMPEMKIPPLKALNADAKWLSKNVQHKNQRRSLEEKNEIKSKLAALVPKDKAPEAKVVRTNTKIPVKNTHRTRSDQLTDTIVKTIAVTHKPKLNGTNLPSETLKQLRTTEHEIANEEPNKIQLRRPSFVQKDTIIKTIAVTHKPKLNGTTLPTETCKRTIEHEIVNEQPNQIQLRRPSFVQKEVVKSTEVKPNGDGSSDHPIADRTANTSETATTTATSPVVKSILKKSNSIQKRRATVTFAEESRNKIKIITNVAPAAPVAPAVRSEEDNVDDVIHNIMALGMSALKQSSSALINGKNFSYKTVAHEYSSLGHLQNVFIPLMKAELWKEIEDGYAHSKNTTATNVQMNYCSRDENYPNRFKCHCEAQSPAAIQNGALVLMLGVHSGKEFLGYITNRQMTNKVCYFQFVTSCYIETNASSGTPLKLKQIMYVRPNLKVFEALFKLKNSPLLQHVLHPRQNCISPQKQHFQYKGYNSLNQDQMITLSSIYRKCIAGNPFISLIEGPPGTGKTRLITNFVLQLLYGKEITQPLKILVCAPSNAAVDILTKNLMEARKNYVIEKGQKKMKLVRFGVLEKMDVSVRGVSIQGLTNQNEKTKLIEQSKLMECKKKKEADLAVCTAKHEREKISAIRKEIGVIEVKMQNVTYDEKCLLEGANVICTTLNSCCALSSKISTIDVCIIDEATQCNEPTSLIPLQFGVKSLILVGDTKQLPSTVLSEIAKQYNYDQSLFQRLQKSFESENKFENPILQLATQYRMHPDILHWPNQYFYKNQLTSADQTDKFPLKLKPYTVFNLNYVQSLHTGQKHISNVDEAKFVRNLLDFLLTKADPKTYTYGIISAYSQQKNDLAKVLSSTHPYVTVNTIDSCQGQERDIVIISIARTRGIGFLAIRQRLNVALTRAKKMLILCGNFNSLQSHPMWTSLLDDARNRKLYIHLPPTIEDSSLCSYFQNTLIT